MKKLPAVLLSLCMAAPFTALAQTIPAPAIPLPFATAVINFDVLSNDPFCALLQGASLAGIKSFNSSISCTVLHKYTVTSDQTNSLTALLFRLSSQSPSLLR